ncbi:MAG TPA: hypothetical protein VH396_13270 [Chitinophagaceae bacterium]|jgi:hypothetical protein
MKQLMLSAAVISFTFVSAFAAPNKKNYNHSNELAKFSCVRALIPAGIQVNKYKFIDRTDAVDDPDSYDVLLYGKNFKGDVLYDEDGKLISYKEELKDTRLPNNVVNAVETKYPYSRITKDLEMINDDQSITDEYKVYFVNGTKHGYALVNADGKIIRSRK